MKNTRNLIKTDIAREAYNPGTYICFFLLISLLWFSVWDDFKVSSEDVVYYYSLSRQSIFNKMSLVISATLCATNFCDDWTSKSFWIYSGRAGIKKYNYSKSVSSFLSGGMMLVFANIVFIVSLSASCMWFNDTSIGTRLVVFPMQMFVSRNKVYWYYIFDTLISFLRNGIFSLLAYCISTYIPNRFVVIASPIIAWFLISFLSFRLQLPSILIATNIYEGLCQIDSPVTWLFYALLLTGMFFMMLYKLSYRNLCRRIN